MDSHIVSGGSADEGKKERVIVIGAGFGGLATAIRLQASGHQVRSSRRASTSADVLTNSRTRDSPSIWDRHSSPRHTYSRISGLWPVVVSKTM